MFKKKKTYVIILLIIAVIGGIYYMKSKKPVAQYTTQAAQKGKLTQTVSVTGKLEAPENADMSFQVSGLVKNLYVDVGDHVTAGQLIATLDPGTLNAQLTAAQAEVKNQALILANMKNQRDSATSGNTKAQRDAQRAQIVKAQAGVSEIFDQFKDLNLYATVSGTIITKGVDAGETIVANSAAGNAPVVTIAEDGPFDVTSNVPESDIIKVAMNQSADITLDAFPATDIFPAKVMEIDPASTVIQDVVYYQVKFAFASPDPKFKNGMSTNVDIHTAEKDNVVSVPQRAINTDNDGKSYVNVLKDAKIGALDKVYVTTGLQGDEGMVEIMSGLSGGENVVTYQKTQ